MTDAQSALDAARTITIIIAGAVVIIGTLTLVAVLGALRERALRHEVARQAARVQALKEEMAGQHTKPTFQTLEDLMKPYKKHLLQSAFDLQSRLNGQLTSTFLNEFKNRSPRDHAYAVDSTTYFFAEFFGWLEVIRRQVVFITGSEYAESLNSLLDSMRFQLTGETPIQGCRKGCTQNDDTFDQNSGILQLYIVDIRSIGNAMLHMVDNLWRPITVDTFLQYMNSEEPQHRAFRIIMHPLRSSLEALSDLDSKAAPVRRIAIFQVLLCKLIDILDNAIPWDMGPKFDSNQEPRYIQRDMRMTPAIRFLSNIQKAHLQSAPFFDDDPNLSFPGFREDMKDQPQEFRDEKLWPGACPPQEPRQRDEEYKAPTQYAHIGARVASVWAVGLRRRKRADPAATAKALTQSPSMGRRMTRELNRSEYAMQRPAELQPQTLGLPNTASGRFRRRSMQLLRAESLARNLAQGGGRMSSMSPMQISPGASRSNGGLSVNVTPALPGAVAEGEEYTMGIDSYSPSSSTSGPEGGGEEGHVLTRAELPSSPGSSSPGARDSLAAGPGRMVPPEHLTEAVEAQHRGRTS